MASEVALIGGGCFWCLEAVYQEVKGVSGVVSGYAGGSMPSPSYTMVCGGSTGHAEVVAVTFDDDVISYREILEIFFTLHDPTTPNRQGNDVGTQYRSVIFYMNGQQQLVAKDVISEMASVWDAPIVTELQPKPVFYPAESEHQNYFKNHPLQGYCAFVVAPKVSKLRTLFTDKLKSD